MNKKIGFIGVGIMGMPMAKNLIKAGYKLVAHDIAAPAQKEIILAGAEEGKSGKDVAERTEIIITMLPNSPDVKDVVLGPGGIIEGVKPGTIFVDMSSIDPLVSKELSAKLAEKGVLMLDAPVSGGEPKAIDGTLSIMVGGSQEVFDQIKEMLLKMGASAVLVGDIGSGNVTKLANNIIVALNIAAVSEALILATKAGVDPEKVYQAIRGGLAGSTVLDAKAPMILDRNFKPGFRVELHIKDLANALSTSHAVGAPLPLTSLMMEIMQYLKVEGKQKADHSAIVNYYEKMAGIEVKRL